MSKIDDDDIMCFGEDGQLRPQSMHFYKKLLASGSEEDKFVARMIVSRSPDFIAARLYQALQELGKLDAKD